MKTMEMEPNRASYETTGPLFFISMTGGKKQTLIGLNERDYHMLLMHGFKDEEVYLSLRKIEDPGPEYTIQVRAGLNTIKMDGDPLFQLRLDVEPTMELIDRGFRDGREAALLIEMSPYRIPSQQLRPEDVELNVFDENDPILDDPDIWLA